MARCGASRVDELYSDVPESCRLKAPYDLPEGLCESEVKEYFADKMAQCKPLVCFAGAGAYDHYTPEAVKSIVSRSEFLTAYTPYQPEISQGTLQYIFEYQSMMTQLTAMEVCNASMYDGATATAEAMMVCVNSARKKRKVLISSTINPDTLAVVATYARYHKIELVTIPSVGGVTDFEALKAGLTADVAGVIVSTPNYFGVLEDFTGLAEAVHSVKALLVINSPASTLAVLKPAGEWGADIAVGEAQTLGIPLSFGGPYLGYMCATKSLMRKLPGRIVGATTDAKGQRVFVLTLQAREQHIRREKATSNICSNQGLMTLHAAVYTALMGYEGLKKVNSLSASGAAYLAKGLTATGKAELTYPDKPFLNEFCITVKSTSRLLEALKAEGILGGVAVDDTHLLVAVTELRTRAQMDKYINVLKNCEL